MFEFYVCINWKGSVFIQTISTSALHFHTRLMRSASFQMQLNPRDLSAFTFEFSSTASLNGSLYVNSIMYPIQNLSLAQLQTVSLKKPNWPNNFRDGVISTALVGYEYLKPFKAYWLRDPPPVKIQQLYALPTLYLCVLCLSENKQRLVPLTA